MPVLTWLRGVIAHRRARLAAAAGGVAVAVALLTSIGVFLSVSRSTMTKRAIASVAVDWQVEGQPGADPAELADAVSRFPGVDVALALGLADSPGFQTVTGASTQTTGAGVVVGLPAGYSDAFPGEVRSLTGAGEGVLLAQQTAANLHAGPGDTVQVARAGLPPVTVVVDGVVDLPVADELFQRVGAARSAQPQAPPDNVLLVPAARWNEIFDAVAGTRTQVHVRIDHRLPADPSGAFSVVAGRARNLEAALAGSGVVGDNLGATLDAARSDALYAQVLFLFLGLPGAVLAALLAASVLGAAPQRRRREQALLRTRGATTRQLLALASAEAALVGTVGALTGLAAGAGVGRLAFGTIRPGPTAGASLGWAAAAAAIGLVVAALTLVVPAWRDARALAVARGRLPTATGRRPAWAGAYLDVGLLALAALVYTLTRRSGYQLVVVPEGVPTVSLDYRAFAGPLFLWSGTGLFAWRLADVALRRGRPLVRRLLRPLAGALSGTVAAALARQRHLLARAAVLVVLTVSFAVSTSVFNATYLRQAGIDARLTNGADVTVTESPGAPIGPGGAATLVAVPGVHTVEPLQHRFAYVGADLQDLYGVRPASIAAAVGLQDSYFSGGTARQILARLAATPDSILVSEETVRDFQLRLGDAVTLRLQDGRTRQLVPVTFHYAGVVREFPTAPRDSFLVTNADYVARATGTDAVGAFLVDTGRASPSVVAGRIRALVGPAASVTDIDTSRQVVGSSLTAVDLAGLTRVELGFGLVLAATSAGLVLALGLTERRRTFAVAGALGATRRQLGSFVWAECAFVLLGGLAAGAAGGLALSHMLVGVLRGVFDPPPAALAVPWVYLGAVAAVTVVAVCVAAQVAVVAAGRGGVAVLREP